MPPARVPVIIGVFGPPRDGVMEHSAGYQGKTALVTGAGGVIGRAICVDLARRGAAVAALDVDQESVQETVRAVQGAGGKATAFRCDITDAVESQRTVASILASPVVASSGRLDILINNAAFIQRTPFLDYSVELIQREITVNLTGHFWVTQAAARHMSERRYGKIVNIGTSAALTGSMRGAAHSAAKAGLFGLTMSLAKELAPYGINVNCVCPGPTEGGGVFQKTIDGDPAGAKAIMDSIPMKRLAKPQDIASAVAFLASDRASYITGLIMSVDGGYPRAP